MWVLLNCAILIEAWLRLPARFKWDPGEVADEKTGTSKSVINPDFKLGPLQILNWEQSYGKDGILTKIAEEMSGAAKSRQIILIDSHLPDARAAIIHQVYFRTALPIKGIPSTVMVTHVDTFFKRILLQWQRRRGLHPVYMSRHSASMLSGDRMQSPDVITPPPAELGVKRKLKVGFFTNVYNDGRKREQILFEALKEADHRWISLFLMGSGLEQFARSCQEIGLEVELTPNFDSEKYAALLTEIDLLIYTGIDEGAISTLDAINAGIPVSVPSIGFNRMLQHPNVQCFDDSQDLTKVFQNYLQAKISSAGCLPTKDSQEYLDKHLLIWERVLNKSLDHEKNEN